MSAWALGKRMKRFVASCLLFLLVVPSCMVSSEGISLEEGHVLVLDASNFTETISAHPFMVVKFYATWCGFCKQLAPEYEKAAAILKGHEPPILFAKVDADEQRNKALARKYGVRGFPTLKIFESKGGIVRDFKGPRDADGIISYLRKEAGPPLEEIVFFEQAGKSVKEKTEKMLMIVFGDTFEALVLKTLKNGHVFVEALLVVVIVYLLLQKSYQPEKRPLTTQEIDQLCDEWSPEPLHPPVSSEMEMETPVLESAAGPRSIVNGEEVINLTSANYLGLMGDKRIVEACTTTLEKYGVGSCGPRGFYGTIDVHLDCELKISEFMGTRDSILYSYGLATAASTIPAFCKRGDLILADEGVSWGIQNGLYLSRSTVRLFKHNDMSSLEALLEDVHKEDQRKRKALNRRFIVVEAIYQNSGQMAPLLDLVRLKEKFRFRLLVDESNSIGVLGDKGRGLTEHFNIPVEKVDIITAAMGHALASVGGFCTGSAKVVDHQRLSGAGYCFSASLPPYVASAAITAISILQENPQLVSRLQQNVTTFRKALADIPGLLMSSHPMSPLIFMHLKSSCGSFKEDSRVLQNILEQMMNKESVLGSMTRRSVLDKCKLPPAIKLAVSVGHTEGDLLAAATSLKKVAASIFESECSGQYEFIK